MVLEESNSTVIRMTQFFGDTFEGKGMSHYPDVTSHRTNATTKSSYTFHVHFFGFIDINTVGEGIGGHFRVFLIFLRKNPSEFLRHVDRGTVFASQNFRSGDGPTKWRSQDVVRCTVLTTKYLSLPLHFTKLFFLYMMVMRKSLFDVFVVPVTKENYHLQGGIRIRRITFRFLEYQHPGAACHVTQLPYTSTLSFAPCVG